MHDKLIKGQTGIELAVLAIMMFVGVLAIFLPVLLFKETSNINIEYEYHYDNSKSLLLSLISTTVPNTQKPMLQLLGEYIQLQAQKKNLPDTALIQNELSNLAKGIDVNCYKLSADTDIAKTSDPKCQPSKYQASATIPLPYNPGNLVKTITLVIEQ